MIPIPLFDNLSCKGRAYVTFALLWLNIAAFIILEWPLTNNALEAFLQHWSVVPSHFTHALASGDLSTVLMSVLYMITASFLHGGWLHLFGNMAFLQAVGRSLEARMGSFAFAIFYLFGCVAAWGMFIFSDPSSSIPALGASGAIAACLGAYLVFYPLAKFRGFILIAFVPLFTVTYAANLLFVWIYYQYLAGFASIINPSAADTVAYFAHIGGALFGVLVASIWRLVKPSSDICYVPISCGGDTTAGKENFRLLLPKALKDRLPGKNHKDCDCDHKH